MYTDTEGIVLKQTKTVNGRRMLLVFSKQYGKISAGTGMNEKGKGKSALAMRPFTLGKYQLYKNRDNYNINGAETVKSFYKLGENVDKYMVCSYVLEWTERVLPEGVANPRLFNLVVDFLNMMEEREKGFDTLVVAFQVKTLKLLGVMPSMDRCTCCGGELEDKTHPVFCIEEGGLICLKCRKTLIEEGHRKLIYDLKFDIVEVLNYFERNPLEALKKLALNQDILKPLRKLIRDYAAFHLDIGELKSASFLEELY